MLHTNAARLCCMCLLLQLLRHLLRHLLRYLLRHLQHSIDNIGNLDLSDAIHMFADAVIA